MTIGDARLFDPLKAIETLDRHGVRYVLIGGFAGRLLGSPLITQNLDICYAREHANLEALTAALVDMYARLRGADDPVPFKLDARTLHRGDTFTFVTDFCDLYVLATPSGTGGYDDLIRTAVLQDLGGLNVMVASVDALIRMTRAAGRPRDLGAIAYLEALKDEIERGTQT